MDEWLSDSCFSTFLLIFPKVVIQASFGPNETKFLLNILWGETTNLSIEIVIVRSVVVNPFNVLYGAEWRCFEAHIENCHVTTSLLLTMPCFGVVLAECEKQELSVMFVLLRLEEF